MIKLQPTDVPADFPVHPLADDEAIAAAVDPVQCGTCCAWWDDAPATEWTPAPSGRCPFEYFHPLMRNSDGQTWHEWATELFEFEYCGECGGDVEDHSPAELLGNWLAVCKLSGDETIAPEH